MDDLKLDRVNGRQIDLLVHVVRISTDDTRIKFGVSKWAMFVIK